MAVQHPARGAASARNNVHVHGPVGAPVLVLLHGFGCDQGIWSRVVPILAEHHRVVLLDHVGAGRSDLSAYDPAKYSTVSGYVHDVLEVCAELELQDVTLVGHSIAGVMAMQVAVLAPERVARLVLLAPSPSYVDHPEDGYDGGFSREDVDELLASLEDNYLAWSAAMAPVLMGNAEQPALSEELAASFSVVEPGIARRFARVTFLTDARALLADVTTPALVVQCADDALAPPHVGRYVHERLAGSSLVHLSARGHIPQVSAPKETAAAILAYTGVTV
ncbi:alpha/beta fold hydrolase [Actinotalea sp. C106]|uniref:alpha/beta fold hydrolase n=1 Tax=Actinotalea sp. C106 TaxID=2908644 RepID=UPI002028B940|nr:alpha/beta hydrolase [Actinotalea sp. C106]